MRRVKSLILRAGQRIRRFLSDRRVYSCRRTQLEFRLELLQQCRAEDIELLEKQAHLLQQWRAFERATRMPPKDAEAAYLLRSLGQTLTYKTEEVISESGRFTLNP